MIKNIIKVSALLGTSYFLYKIIKKDIIINKLNKYIGIPYVWGGETPTYGFDCSGFTQYVYKKYFNKNIPRTSNQQYNESKNVLIPTKGDLIFFGNPNCEDSTHVGIYIGNGKMIHAGSSNGIIIAKYEKNNYWEPRFRAIKRPNF